MDAPESTLADTYASQASLYVGRWSQKVHPVHIGPCEPQPAAEPGYFGGHLHLMVSVSWRLGAPFPPSPTFSPWPIHARPVGPRWRNAGQLGPGAFVLRTLGAEEMEG